MTTNVRAQIVAEGKRALSAKPRWRVMMMARAMLRYLENWAGRTYTGDDLVAAQAFFRLTHERLMKLRSHHRAWSARRLLNWMEAQL